MQDYYRNAIAQLLMSNYDVFLPAQHPTSSVELVVSNGEWLRQCVVRPILVSKVHGPFLRVSLAEDNPTLDAVIASWPAHQLAWIIPIEAARQAHIVRLGKHDDWLVSLIDRPDAIKHATNALKEQLRTEGAMAKEATDEIGFLQRVLSSRDDKDADDN